MFFERIAGEPGIRRFTAVFVEGIEPGAGARVRYAPAEYALDVIEFVRNMSPSTAIVLKSGFPTETSEIMQRLGSLGVEAIDKSAPNQVQQLVEAVSRAVSRQKAK